VLEDFAAPDEVAKLKQRAEEIIDEYDASNPSVFSTVNQACECSIMCMFCQPCACTVRMHLCTKEQMMHLSRSACRWQHAPIQCYMYRLSLCANGRCRVNANVSRDMIIGAAPQKFRTDNQFLDSANGISVFLEEKAMDGDNRLQKPKALAVNKIGHAMHDLDPVFRDFSRSGCDCGPSRAWRSSGHCHAYGLTHLLPNRASVGRSEKMQSLFRSLAFKRPLPVQSMYICKQPKIGGEVVPHQDSTFLWCDFALPPC
jgi:Phytanoyl-CoA dioxygenase (PhyH)